MKVVFDLTEYMAEHKNEERLATPPRDLGSVLTERTFLHDNLQLCLGTMLDMFGLDSGWIHLLDTMTGDLRLVCHQGVSSEFAMQHSRYTLDSPEIRLITGNGPVYLSHRNGDLPSHRNILEEDIRAAAVIPVYYQQNIIGCLIAASRIKDEIGPSCRSAIEMFAHHIGIFKRRSILAESIQNKDRKFRERENRYRTIFENTGTATFIFDEHTTILIVNDEFEKLSGYGRAEIEGRMSWQKIVADSDLDRLMSYHRMRGADSATAPRNYEFLLKDKQGNEKNVFLTIEMIPGSTERVASLLDITDMKKIAQALQDNEALLRQIIDLVPHFIFAKNRRGEFIMANQAVANAYGVPMEQLIGKADADFNPNAQEVEHFLDDDLAVIDAGVSKEIKEETITDAEGRIRWLNTFKIPFFHKSTGQAAVLGVSTDITALKAMEEERIQLEEQLRQAHKMEAIGTLAGGIAHDFNNILGGIIGYADLARFKTSDEAIQPYLDRIFKGCDRARDLVNQILTFSRRTEQEKKPLLIVPLAKEAMKLIRSSLPSTVDIRLSYTNKDTMIQADPTQIHQVLMNLCSNAAYAMRGKGGLLKVSITEEYLKGARTGSSSAHLDGHYLKLTISDTGHGIEPAVIDRIFDPFFTTKGPGEGTGLGLAVVYGIVKNHGGSISVVSAPGTGTTFVVHLPLAETDERPVEINDALIPRGTGRVLFVDDEEHIASLGKEILTALGYDVTVRYSSLDALEAFRAHPQRFDVVITDMTMPNMTGASLAKEILNVRPDLPIILTTGYSDLINEEKAAQMGIKAFVMKPFSLQDLAQIVHRTIA